MTTQVDDAVMSVDMAHVEKSPLDDVLATAPQVFSLAAQVTAGLGRVRDELFRVGSDDLAPALGLLGDLVRSAEAAMTGLTAEALDRGVVGASRCAGPTAWVRQQAGITEPGRARAVSEVAAATLDPGTGALADAVWSGAIGVGAAQVVLSESEKVRPLLPGASREQVLGHYLDHARTLHDQEGLRADRRALRQLTRQVIARYGQDTLDDMDERARECSSLTERALPTGLVQFTLEVNQPDATRLRTAVAGLAAPRSDTDEQGRPVRDPRTPARRRAEALMELVTRAQAADGNPTAGGCGLGGATTLIVTADHHTLLERLGRQGDGASGHVSSTEALAEPRPARPGRVRRGWARPLPGSADDAGPTSFATTFDGSVLTPAQVRQAACDANILPAVLGSDSAPMDIGRASRTATPAQRAHLALRDGGCTFPGCDRPPGWCHAHHIKHWADGGATALANLALLCQRHHTVVHRDRLTATRDGDRWHWHPAEDPDPP
ncbi:HNH endonuclease signature motif containing protein [Kytococcus sp. Marseille-QA3725]